MLAPLTMLAFITRSWLVSEWMSKSSEFAGVGSAVGFVFLTRTWLMLKLVSESPEVAGVGSAVEVGFY